MRRSESMVAPVRGLNLHLRHWPGERRHPCWVLHGWSDTAATWDRVVRHLPPSWPAYAPDWRGFGQSSRNTDTYIFPDYLGDLDALLDLYSPQPVDLIGHSMGGQIAALYAGLRPERVRRLIILDALFLPLSSPSKAPQRLREWLDDLRTQPRDKIYDSLEEFAQRVAKYHAGLDAAGAMEVASAWSESLADGRVRLLADPRHRQRGPLLYRDEEARAIFSQIQAPTLILDAAQSNLKQMCPADVRQARLDAIAHHEHQVLPDCGHMLHFDAPEQTAAVIQEFLQRA